MLYKETVAEPTLELLKQLMALPELAPFSLVGGTNLALRLGHRISVDIDLFTSTESDLAEVRNAIAQTFPNALLKISWPEVKASLRNHVRNYTSSILE